MNDPYEGAILSALYSGASATKFEDKPVAMYSVGNMKDVGINYDYDAHARANRIAEHSFSRKAPWNKGKLVGQRAPSG